MTSTTPPSFAGVFPPIPTPFDAEGNVAHAQLHANLARWNQEPLDGYVVLGSNGEFPYLSTDERVDLVRAARESVPAERLLIAGAGMESTRETIAMTRRMAAAGADAAIVVTPNYYKAKMNSAALAEHYRRVADASPVPVLIYNMPPYTGVDIPVDAIVAAAAHPNIVGMKESNPSAGKLGLIVREAPPDFQVFTGSASGFLAALAVGAVGGVMALANFAAAPLAELFSLFHAGELERARSLQHRLIPPNVAVTTRFGIAGVKAALDMLGYYGGPVRAPLQPLSDGERAQLREILVRAELLA